MNLLLIQQTHLLYFVGILAIHKLNTTELHQRIQMLEARFIDFESIKGNYLHKCRLIGKRLISELDKSAVVTAKNKMLSGFKTDLTALKDQLVTESRNKRQKISSPSNESLSVSSDRSERSKKYTETKDDSHSFAMVKNYNINSANKSISIQSNATTHQNNTFSSDTNSNHNNKAAKNNNTSIHTSINHTKPNTRSDTPEKSLLSIQEPKPTYILPQSHVLRQELVMILDRKQGTLTSLLTLPPFPPQPSFDFAHELKQMMELEKETTPVASTLNHHTVSDTCNTDNPAACQSHDSHVAYTSNNSVADIPSRSTKRYREDDHVYTEPSKRIATSSPIRGIQQQESTYLGFETPYMYSDDEDVPVLNNERPPWKTIGDIYDIDLLTPMRKN
jgi:hypothetical protein